MGCQAVSIKDGRVVSIAGDRKHPINEGTLCSKGAAACQVVNNPLRLKTPLYRAPGPLIASASGVIAVDVRVTLARAPA